MSRTAWKPTQEQRLAVSIMAACGMPQPSMCAQVINQQTGKPVSEKTLRAKFKQELADGREKANALMAQSLFKKGTGTGTGAVAAAIFWLKTRAGWREAPQQHEISGPNGGPIRTARDMSDDELAAIAAGSSAGTSDPQESAG